MKLLTPKRRWYQFSLRTLMIVVTLSAVATGWWVHRSFCLERAGFFTERSRVLHMKYRPKHDPLDVFYKRTEREYRRAVWQPWLRLWIDEKPPQSVMRHYPPS